MSRLLCDKRMPIRWKGKLYKIVMRPTILNGCVRLVAVTITEQFMSAVNMRILRNMLGSVKLLGKNEEYTEWGIV